uniref:Serine/threonine-protein kinase VRK1 n=1 Tax=Caenorhabditis tropicalis TaxID=1561998 RepID=A0A1I7UA39_9PELO
MPPKKAPAKKLHELAPEVKTGFKINDISKKTFIVGKQFATGGFGRIYTCTEEGKSHQMVMKIEPSTNGPLMTEVVVFNRILKKEMLEAYKKEKKIGWTGLPYLIANGYFTYNSEKMRYMIIPKYAMSLEAAREANGGTLSAKDSMTVSNCILGALEFLHESDYAHADVKAANILLEKQNDYSTAVLVDFGLAHRTTNNIDKPDKKRAHNGTCIFTSTDAHRGNNPSFRGDVEILAYNLIMWLSGTLPWLALESSPDKVFDSKQKFVAGLPSSLQNLLTKQSSAVVGCLSSMFAITMKTNYTDKVDMGKLKKLVRDAIKSGSEQKTNASVKTPKKSSKVVKEEDDEVADFEDEEKETIKPKKKKVTKNVEADKIAKKTQSKIADDDDDEEIIIPSSSRSRRNRLESGEKRSELLPVSGRKHLLGRSLWQWELHHLPTQSPKKL